jgi:hypothetical protein
MSIFPTFVGSSPFSLLTCRSIPWLKAPAILAMRPVIA